jgi:hypothetical protein
MPLTEEFQLFLRETAKKLEPFCQKYVTPLRAFLSVVKNFEDQKRYQEIEEIELTADYVYSELEKILAQDSFLRQCCGDKERLAHALDVLFFSRISDCFVNFSFSAAGLGASPGIPNPQLLDKRINELESELYGQGNFEKHAYFHLFNFETLRTEDLPPPPYSGWEFRKLDFGAKAQLLGETGFSSFLSPTGTGEYFLFVKDEEGFDSESLETWLNRRWEDAFPYCQILQYSKDAIVDIDYVVPDFNPPWVNQVQRGGLYYSGMPRKDEIPIALCYGVGPGDLETIQALWGLYQKHADKLKLTNTPLRKAISIAGEFFEDSHKKVNRIEQFANLIIALEALYTPSEKNELTFRISQSCALLVVGDSGSNTIHDTFEFLQAMFKKRGKLFHGQYGRSASNSEIFINDEELVRLICIVSISILNFTTLFLRGENNLNKVREDIQKAVLDESFRGEFLKKADIETFLKSDGI